jgi:DNA-binding CsgD family transcriptional regulator
MRMCARINNEEAGLLLLGPANRLVYANAEAIGVLAYPRKSKETRVSDSDITERIRSLLLNGAEASRPAAGGGLFSGRRRYVCRFFSLERHSGKPGGPRLAVIMERAYEASFLISLAAQEYHLSSREKETVQLLLGGLTSKEIAQRMRISPNTVKNFLRLAMIKMGVSTRSGIAARVLHTSHSASG